MFLREEPSPVASDHALQAITNEHDRLVLAMTQARPVEAREIIDATGIPRSTVYRRLRELTERDLVRVSGAVVRDGHHVDRYESVCDRIALIVSDADVRVGWVLAGGDGLDERPLWSWDGQTP